MKKTTGICFIPFVPVRAEASERAEMVTQLIFGELFRVISEKTLSGFCKIRSLSDGYEGWVSENSVVFLDHKEWRELSSRRVILSQKRFTTVVDPNGNDMIISAGSILRLDKENKISGSLSIYEETKAILPIREGFKNNAEQWINTPYLWGGKTCMGTDCSGLVQNLYHQAGMDIPRDASAQALTGRNIHSVSEARPGDLAFFDNEAGKIIHVGIILEGGMILHASSKVRKDTFDERGIFSSERAKYSHNLRMIRNLID